MGGGARYGEGYGVYASGGHGARGWCIESRVD